MEVEQPPLPVADEGGCSTVRVLLRAQKLGERCPPMPLTCDPHCEGTHINGGWEVAAASGGSRGRFPTVRVLLREFRQG